MNNYKGYSLFNDVESAALKAYNRVVTMFNIVEDMGRAEATKYAKQFSEVEKRLMQSMASDIKQHGPTQVKKGLMQ